MKQVVYKWEVPMYKGGLIPGFRMNKGAQILTIQTQHGVPMLWALVDPMAPKEERMIEVYGTGHTMEEIPKGRKRVHLGSFKMENDKYIFHVFDLVPDPGE